MNFLLWMILLGNSIPMLFIQDAMKFPDLAHSASPG